MSIDHKTAYGRSGARRQDQVCFWREQRYDDLECLKARFFHHSYTPHTHDTFAVGVIISGAEAFRYKGSRHIAPAGSLVAVNPDELHDGEPEGDAYAYRMFYPSVSLVQQIAKDLDEGGSGQGGGFVAFREPVIDDPELAASFIQLHALLEYGAPRLAVDEAFTEAMTVMVARHGDKEHGGRRLGRESQAVGRVRRMLDDCYMQDLTLEELAQEAGFSRFHLLRRFRREVGVTPHTYLTGRRVAAAKEGLAGAAPLSDIAVTSGFYDQSHFTRALKGWTGLTPGQYRRGLRRLEDKAESPASGQRPAPEGLI